MNNKISDFHLNFNSYSKLLNEPSNTFPSVVLLSDLYQNDRDEVFMEEIEVAIPWFSSILFNIFVFLFSCIAMFVIILTASVLFVIHGFYY